MPSLRDKRIRSTFKKKNGKKGKKGKRESMKQFRDRSGENNVRRQFSAGSRLRGQTAEGSLRRHRHYVEQVSL